MRRRPRQGYIDKIMEGRTHGEINRLSLETEIARRPIWVEEKRRIHNMLAVLIRSN